MTQKEKVKLGLSLTVLMDAILDKNLNSDEVANNAINFMVDILNRFPELRLFINDIICGFSEKDEDFNDKWNRHIEWINWEKQMLET